jgi:hypothetical protein
MDIIRKKGEGKDALLVKIQKNSNQEKGSFSHLFPKESVFLFPLFSQGRNDGGGMPGTAAVSVLYGNPALFPGNSAVSE